MIRGIRCPKCKSTAVSAGEFLNRHWSSTQMDWKLSCMMCGTVAYGTTAKAEIERQLQAEATRKAEEERLDALLRENFSRSRAETVEQLPDPPAEIIVSLEVLAPQNNKCAWHKCSEPKRANSMYCSSKCRVAKAHANEWERRKAAKRTGADVSSVQGVSSDRESA